MLKILIQGDGQLYQDDIMLHKTTAPAGFEATILKRRIDLEWRVSFRSWEGPHPYPANSQQYNDNLSPTTSRNWILPEWAWRGHQGLDENHSSVDTLAIPLGDSAWRTP